MSVTVTCVNDPPVADDETFGGADGAVGNTTFIVNDPTDGAPTVTGPNKTITGDILAGDTDVDGPGPLVVAAGTITTNDGGSVTIQADGDFTYTPAAGTSCTDTSDFFDYTRQRPEPAGTPGTDTGHGDDHDQPTASGTCRADAPAGGDGTLADAVQHARPADTAATGTGADDLRVPTRRRHRHGQRPPVSTCSPTRP